MKKTRRSNKIVSAESVAKMADAGKDISPHFTNKGKMMPPIQRVNVDFTAEMLKELDETAEELNVSRQSVIKTLVRMGLNGRYLAGNSKKKTG
jgi:hypothetical protein